MRKNGFTLIELLAILVILAIIAVITIPKISQIIEKSRIESAKISAIGYMDSIKKNCMSGGFDDDYKLPEECDIDGDYVVENGILKKDDSIFDVAVNGDAPSDGFLYIHGGDVYSGCLKIGKYAVTIKGENNFDTKKGDCSALNSD